MNEELFCPIFENANIRPNHPALITDHYQLTYFELNEAVNSLCNHLKTLGVGQGQRVAFIAKTHPTTPILLFSLFRLGAIACPLSFRIPETQLPSLLTQLGTSHYFDPASFPLSSSKDSRFSSISLNQLATILMTSGTGSTPKMAGHLFSNHHYSAKGATTLLKLTSSSRFLLSLPLFHVSGLGILFRCFQTGATVVISELTQSETLFKHHITHVSQVPTQLYRMLKEPSISPSLQCVLLGGAPLSPTLIEQALNKNTPLFTTYGMTEMSSLITLLELPPFTESFLPTLNAPMGKTATYREIKVESDREIWVRGKTLFQGYWDPQTNSFQNPLKEGWFPTKDLGQLDKEGVLRIYGRKDRQFISGGENIQPEEIEQALCSIPGIIQASVLPREDIEFGKRPVAFIRDDTGAHTLESIKESLSPYLPSFKHPIAIFPYPEEVGIKPNLSILSKILQ